MRTLRRVAPTAGLLAGAAFAALLLAASPATSGGDAENEIFIKNSIRSGPAQFSIFVGHASQIAAGDFDGSGSDGFAVRDGKTITLVDAAGATQGTASFGLPTDTVFLTGDWNGSGTDGFAVVRGNIVLQRNSPSSGPASNVFAYGIAGDEYFSGDFDGDGVDTIAVRRGNLILFRNSNSSGPASGSMGYGKAGDQLVFGDWDDDGIDTPAVRRTNLVFLRNSNTTGKADDIISYGIVGDRFLAGDFDGNSTAASAPADSFAVARSALIDLQLLAFNDYHGHLEATTPGTVDGAAAGGSEYLSSLLNQLRDGQRYSLTVAAGDLIGGSPAFSGLFHDEPSVESLNAMHLDVSGVGNHEFDEGVTELLRMQEGGCHPVDGCYFPDAPYPGADFQWLAANVVNDAGETPLPPYWIERVQNVDVAFIGMTLEATDTLVAAAGIEGWDFLDEAETANALVPTLQDQGVEAIIVLLHEGGSQTPPPGDVDACVGISGPIVAINDALDPEIDALITGHTHLPYNCVLPDSAGAPRIVTSAYSFGRVVSELHLVLDRRTNDVRRDLSTSRNHTVDQASLTPDPRMTRIIERWQPLVDAAGDTPVGTITADINRGGDPPGDDRGVESPAGNLVADAQLWATSSNFADVAFMNPGGVRSDLTFADSGGEGDGVVTFAEAFTFQPFGNTLVTYAMTGAEIISVLEEQCQPAGSSRPFLHLGVPEGFTYDLAKTIEMVGTDLNCTSVTISNVKLNGVDLDPAAIYNVTVNSFLADGGDNFDTLGTITTPRLDGGNDLLALTNYLGTFSPVSPPPVDRVNELP